MKDSTSPHNWVAEHIAVLPKSGIRDFFELVNSMTDVVSLGIGEPDFATPWHIREATIYALHRGFTHYTSNLGDLRLRKAIVNYAQQNFGVSYSPETECIVTVGVSEGLDILMRSILNPGDEVLYHEPCYVSYAPTIRMTHAVPVAVQTREEKNFVLDIADLEAKVTARTKALLLNYPNNPTGAGLTAADKQALADFVQRHDLLLISDEIYEELSYVPRSASIAALPGMKERTVVLNGMSKAFAMTGYRLGYAMGPAMIIDAMMKVHQYSMLCAPVLSQAAALEALRKGSVARESMRQEYEQRRNVIVKRLNEMGLRCFLPHGAFYVFPCIQGTGLNSYEFAMQLLQQKKVAVVPGTAFGPSGEGFVRCSYAAKMEDIETAMSRMQEFLTGK